MSGKPLLWVVERGITREHRTAPVARPTFTNGFPSVSAGPFLVPQVITADDTFAVPAVEMRVILEGLRKLPKFRILQPHCGNCWLCHEADE